MDAHVKEFDCVECGHHIVSICPPDPAEVRCAHCIVLPGWFNDPKLREWLREFLPYDPDKTN